METAVWRPVWIGIDKSHWAQEGNGRLQNWKFSNIRVMEGGKYHSQVYGGSSKEQIQNIEFLAYDYDGQIAQSAANAKLDVVGPTDGVMVRGSEPGCPGGSLEACTSACPSDIKAFKACVAECQ